MCKNFKTISLRVSEKIDCVNRVIFVVRRLTFGGLYLGNRSRYRQTESSFRNCNPSRVGLGI